LNVRVLFVASECVPFVKTGGLADVVGALPKALAPLGPDVRVMLPAYPALGELAAAGTGRIDLGELNGGSARLVAARAAGLDLLLLDAPHLFDRPGNPYLGPDGSDWPDNHLRFGALSMAVARLATNPNAEWRPDIVHAHDWQAGLVPAYLRTQGRPGPFSVMTVHNAAFQGLFPVSTIVDLDLPATGFTADGYEFHGKVGFLKAGLTYADRITTVSPTYARELMSPELGMGLEGVFAARSRDLAGILNGIDLVDWNPATDRFIASPYSSRTLARKAANKAALEASFGLPANSGAPLFCAISRLTSQKGIDVLIETLPRLVSRGARLVLLGTGEAALEAALIKAARDYPYSVAVRIAYDEPLSHLVQAGADAILVPSRFEPCGLTQLCGLRYGTLPVVARTGGLADTVIDANDAALEAGCATGFQFAPVSADALGDAIDRVCGLYSNRPMWMSMVEKAMKHPVGWESSAQQYAALYRSLVDAQ
jgi:starch synthase